MNVPVKFQVRSFNRFSGNMGTQKIGQSLDMPMHTPYSYMCTRLPEIIDWSFGWVFRTPNLREGKVVGVGDGTARRSVGELHYAIHSNFFSNFTRFRDIVAFNCATARHFFSTPSLVSPKFLHVPWGLRRAKVLS